MGHAVALQQRQHTLRREGRGGRDLGCRFGRGGVAHASVLGEARLWLKGAATNARAVRRRLVEGGRRRGSPAAEAAIFRLQSHFGWFISPTSTAGHALLVRSERA